MTRLIALTLAAGLVLAAPAHADGLSVVRERAGVLARMPYGEFLDSAAAAEAPFDWSTDGCSRTPPAWAIVFDGACRQHDYD